MTPARSVRRLLTAAGAALLGASLALGSGLPAVAADDTVGNPVAVESGDSPLQLSADGAVSIEESSGSLVLAGPTWTPEPDSVAYRWFRDGAPIIGSDAPRYRLAAADYGRSITVAITASASGYEDSTVVSPPYAVPLGRFVTTVPAISGTPTVGATLTATAGAWTPAPEKVAYQWLRSGVAIGGATSSSYKLSAADAGKSVSVRVTGTALGYTSASTTSAARTIGKALTAPKPTVSGSTIVGSTLTVKTGTWGPAPVSVKVQWLRDGVAIAGATKSTYKLGSADAGKTVTARVTGSRSGYTTVVATSAGKPTLRALTATPVPAISGSGSVGSTLTVKTYTWGPSPVALKVQWYRDGKAISGASRTTYKLVNADAGRTITVRVTGSKSGYTTATKTSAGRKATWPANPGDTKNCSDFRTQAEAQAWFDRYYPAYGDVARLDADNDRIACETLR